MSDRSSALSEQGASSTALNCTWTLLDIIKWAALRDTEALCPKCGRVPADHEDDRGR